MDNTQNGNYPNGQQPSIISSGSEAQQQYPNFAGQPMPAPIQNQQYGKQKNPLIYIIPAVAVGAIALIIGLAVGKGMSQPGDQSAQISGSTNQSGQNSSSSTQTPDSTNNSASNSGSNIGAPVVTLDAKELKDNYNDVNFSQYIGKTITLKNILAYHNDDGTISLSPGLMSFFGISCSNDTALNLENNEWYTITGVLSNNTRIASHYYLTNCTAVKQ